MDAARSRNICRRFINGTCRLGTRCNFRHERTAISESQICRYFQKGGCWYGEHCRYLHILRPNAATAFPGRRGSVPFISSSVNCPPPERRGSEPTLPHRFVTPRQEPSGSAFSINDSLYCQNNRNLPGNIVEERSQENVVESAHSSEDVQASACHESKGESSKSEAREEGATAASSTKSEADETEAFQRSKNVVCGICMEIVCEKEDKRDQVFGLLPNCNHSFCLQCIAKWRKTKDLGPEVVRTCPQCRVRSAFYVPNKFWVEGQEKESVVAAFKKKFNKKRCEFYDSNGYCPFKTDCLYRHVKDANRIKFSHSSDDEDDDFVDFLGFFIAMGLFGCDDDDEDLPFYLVEEI